MLMRPGLPIVLTLLLVGCGSNTDSDAGGMDAQPEDRDASSPLGDGGFGDPDSGSTSGTVGPAGGTVNLGQLTLTIPPGALTREVEIGIEILPPSTDVPDGFESSDIYRLTPEGLEFAVPVTADVDVSASPDGQAAIRWTRRGSMEWEVLATTVAGSVASAESDHFSWMDVVYGAACLLAAHGGYFQPCCEGMCFGALECRHETEFVLPGGVNLGVCDVDWLECGRPGEPCCLTTEESDWCDGDVECGVRYMRGQIPEGTCACPVEECSTVGEEACVDYGIRGLHLAAHCVEKIGDCGPVNMWQFHDAPGCEASSLYNAAEDCCCDLCPSP